MERTSTESDLSRRQLLVSGIHKTIGLTVLAGAAANLAGCAIDMPPRPKVDAGTVNIGQASKYRAGTVDSEYVKEYGICVSDDGGTITAISPVCTHKGCLTHWHPDRNEFICPCHGSRYDIEGLVVHGPTTHPLHRVPAIRNADGTLSVNLTELNSQPYPFQKRRG